MKRKIALYNQLLRVMEQTEHCLSSGRSDDMQRHLQEIMTIQRQIATRSTDSASLAADPELQGQLGKCLRELLKKTERLRTMAETKKAAIADELHALSRAMRMVPGYQATVQGSKGTLSITS